MQSADVAEVTEATEVAELKLSQEAQEVFDDMLSVLVNDTVRRTIGDDRVTTAEAVVNRIQDILDAIFAIDGTEGSRQAWEDQIYRDYAKEVFLRTSAYPANLARRVERHLATKGYTRDMFARPTVETSSVDE